ncbi:SAG family member [Eimeria mitis]|uniref:SAG family member n=1 Tax=Eimeria mitis TaxID=44415 RepID=U6KH70_9EIME|nr:SAG family member [Eimeria mitis]CDJ36141.1 SAG family member [Eimeria mitis]
MAPLKIVSLACASALLIAQANTQGAQGQGEEDIQATPTYTVALGNTAVCLAEINGAREDAGLAHFTAAANKEEMWPATDEGDNTHWDPVCEALIAKDAEGAKVKGASTTEFKSGTYAFMALESDTPDCAAAVDHWKDAVSNFTSVPPPKTGEDEPYDKQHNISFVAMFNPSENASADCRVVTCTQTTTQQPSAFNLRNSGDEKKGYALLCMTTPDAFKNAEAPFSEDQWNKIKASLTGSASVVAPNLLVFAIAALGLAAI